MSLPEKRIVMESASTLLPLYHSFGLSTQGTLCLILVGSEHKSLLHVLLE